MIISKGNLLALEVAGRDNTPMLKHLLICKNGITMASSRNTIIAIGSISAEVKKQLPFDETKLSKDIILHESTVKDMVSNIPRDRLFQGKLEFCDIDSNCKISMHDGQREH